jgi:putative transcriptional regulator
MIQCRLRELMAVKGRREHRRITYDDIWTATGIAKTTLTRLANDRSDRVAMATIERLCVYFDCQPGDLFVYVADA